MGHDDRLLFLLSTAQKVVMNHTNKALSAEGVRITVAQSGILFLLKRENRRKISEIGKILDIENSAMTGLTDRLEKSGFVQRLIDPADRRALLLSITPAGLEEVGKAKPIIRGINDAIKEGFSEHEVECFKSVLDGMIQKFRRT